jgi:hypothetical protein
MKYPAIRSGHLISVYPRFLGKDFQKRNNVMRRLL